MILSALLLFGLLFEPVVGELRVRKGSAAEKGSVIAGPDDDGGDDGGDDAGGDDAGDDAGGDDDTGSISQGSSDDDVLDSAHVPDSARPDVGDDDHDELQLKEIEDNAMKGMDRAWAPIKEWID